MIIWGDFGGLWTGDFRDQYWLDWLNKKSFTTLFVDGNHDNFELLNAHAEISETAMAAKSTRYKENILHLMILLHNQKKYLTEAMNQ